MSVTFVGEAADAATALSARRTDIVRGWADLPLFTTVFAGQRDDAEATAGLLLDALIAVARSGRTDDFSAPSFGTPVAAGWW
jgi:rsbT co-antagonist protein RsbR